MLYASDPVGNGFVKGISRPGTNITGLTFDPSPDLYAKNVELAKAALPRATRIGVLFNPQFYYKNAATKANLASVTEAVRQVGVAARLLPVANLAEIDATFRSLMRDRPDALVIVPDAFVTFQHVIEIARLTLAQRLPSVHAFSEYVHAGGLLSYGPSIIEQPRHAAGHIDRLLRGANPAELPVEQPSRFELAINLQTAKALGLTIPPSLLLRADQVIE
jgi:putative ABC transport system substrate-binding protein